MHDSNNADGSRVALTDNVWLLVGQSVLRVTCKLTRSGGKHAVSSMTLYDVGAIVPSRTF